ncbi:MAG: hypothetical protein LBE61_00375 [Burkholderiaceae bacterium]|nr:hypothetical protein [Burkholderiaceae bacterium]
MATNLSQHRIARQSEPLCGEAAALFILPAPFLVRDFDFTRMQANAWLILQFLQSLLSLKSQFLSKIKVPGEGQFFARPSDSQSRIEFQETVRTM